MRKCLMMSMLLVNYLDVAASTISMKSTTLDSHLDTSTGTPTRTALRSSTYDRETIIITEQSSVPPLDSNNNGLSTPSESRESAPTTTAGHITKEFLTTVVSPTTNMESFPKSATYLKFPSTDTKAGYSTSTVSIISETINKNLQLMPSATTTTPKNSFTVSSSMLSSSSAVPTNTSTVSSSTYRLTSTQPTTRHHSATLSTSNSTSNLTAPQVTDSTVNLSTNVSRVFSSSSFTPVNSLTVSSSTYGHISTHSTTRHHPATLSTSYSASNLTTPQVTDSTDNLSTNVSRVFNSSVIPTNSSTVSSSTYSSSPILTQSIISHHSTTVQTSASNPTTPQVTDSTVNLSTNISRIWKESSAVPSALAVSSTPTSVAQTSLSNTRNRILSGESINSSTAPSPHQPSNTTTSPSKTTTQTSISLFSTLFRTSTLPESVKTTPVSGQKVTLPPQPQKTSALSTSSLPTPVSNATLSSISTSSTGISLDRTTNTHSSLETTDGLSSTSAKPTLSVSKPETVASTTQKTTEKHTTVSTATTSHASYHGTSVSPSSGTPLDQFQVDQSSLLTTAGLNTSLSSSLRSSTATPISVSSKKTNTIQTSQMTAGESTFTSTGESTSVSTGEFTAVSTTYSAQTYVSGTKLLPSFSTSPNETQEPQSMLPISVALTTAPATLISASRKETTVTSLKTAEITPTSSAYTSSTSKAERNNSTTVLSPSTVLNKSLATQGSLQTLSVVSEHPSNLFPLSTSAATTTISIPVKSEVTAPFSTLMTPVGTRIPEQSSSTKRQSSFSIYPTDTTEPTSSLLHTALNPSTFSSTTTSFSPGSTYTSTLTSLAGATIQSSNKSATSYRTSSSTKFGTTLLETIATSTVTIPFSSNKVSTKTTSDATSIPDRPFSKPTEMISVVGTSADKPTMHLPNSTLKPSSNIPTFSDLPPKIFTQTTHGSSSQQTSSPAILYTVSPTSSPAILSTVLLTNATHQNTGKSVMNIQITTMKDEITTDYDHSLKDGHSLSLESNKTGGLSVGGKVALGLCIPALVLVLVGVAFWLYRRRKYRGNWILTTDVQYRPWRFSNASYQNDEDNAFGFNVR